MSSENVQPERASAVTPAPDYIHGFGTAEEQRLRNQSTVLAEVVFHEWVLPSSGRLLEIGCGVGAELELIAQRWPGLELTGIELNGTHAAAAEHALGGRATVVRGDAHQMPFADDSFDIGITIWVLEHAHSPIDVIREAVRVVHPDGRLIFTEVDNSTFRFKPELPAIAGWWKLFCHQQQQAGGDPYVGGRLADLAHAAGCRDIEARELSVLSCLAGPSRRAELLNYLEELLLSGAAHLLEFGGAKPSTLAALRADFEKARRDSSIEFQYHAVRLTCRPAPHQTVLGGT
ncbi:MAG: class I SAM-dependent methyltransferase [Planctomycetales bacterium]|jgi:ubiquinone/menaquinone biosynthesis C-methylase UbiE|nr:class I SAM-dependent methyltransferase [Planctomycetales bacterium]